MKHSPSGVAQEVRVPGDDVHGFLPGSIVLTLDGALPAEYLGPGDRIITRDAGMATLRGVERFTALCDSVAVPAGTLGADRPDRDVILPASQQVLLRDWRARALFGQNQALCPLGRLIDGEFIRHAGRKRLDLIRLGFDAPHILYVDGMELACAPGAARRKAA